MNRTARSLARVLISFVVCFSRASHGLRFERSRAMTTLKTDVACLYDVARSFWIGRWIGRYFVSRHRWFDRWERR